MGILRQYYSISDNIKECGYNGFMERFPILFQNSSKSPIESCMSFGIDCPIGWYYILDQLCTVLEFYNIEYTRKYNIGIVADQVKEKFGTLRFYFHIADTNEHGEHCETLNGTNPKFKDDNERSIVVNYLEMLVHDIISDAENLTANTCSQCGVPLTFDNRVETKGWITYICKKCEKKRVDAMNEIVKRQNKEFNSDIVSEAGNH